LSHKVGRAVLCALRVVNQYRCARNTRPAKRNRLHEDHTDCFLARSEKRFAAGANVSIGKARTSAIFKKPTKDFEDTINKGRFTMTALPDFTPLQGGVPIVHEGHVIGAIGVSGAKSAAQDEEVAKAGAAAVADAQVAAK
jgi:uncharacterized protein GlcG (DUF336 family)